MKKSNFILSILSLGMLLAGCNGNSVSSTIPASSMEPSVTPISLTDSLSEESESSSSDVPSISKESSSKGTPVESSSSEGQVEPEIAYTAAEAIDAVADLMSSAFGEAVSANHTDEGEYIVLNLGDAEHDTIKAYTEYYFIPEGFEKVADWAEDAFGDGTPVEYADFACGDTGLEYLVYDVSGYEGDQEGYNGAYLQVQAFDLGSLQ